MLVIIQILYDSKNYGRFGWSMVLHTTINNISVRSVLLVEETGVPGENHRPVASY